MADIFLDGKDAKRQFKLIKKLGTGGFGVVYEADDTKNNSKVAIKIFQNVANLTDEQAADAWKKEAEQSLSVSGNNVIKYIDFIQAKMPDNSEGSYLVMELANNNLSNLLEAIKEKDDFIPEDELVSMFIQILNGMESVHKVLIHRDLKPENVLILDDVLKISDFGLAKFVDETTRTKSFKGWGTIKYMAPESWALGQISKATDIYSLGVMFYQMATFELPFSSAEEKEMEELHRFGDIPSVKSVNDSLSHKVEGVIRKMMQKSPQDRYQAVDEVATDLKGNSLIKQVDVSGVVNLAKDILKKTEHEKSEAMKTQELYDKKLKIVQLKITEFIKQLEVVIENINANIPEEKLFLSKGSNTSYTLIWNKKDLMRFNFDQDIFNSDLTIKGLQLMALCTVQNVPGRTDEGYNFILVENENDEYGSWKVLEVNASVFANRAQYPRIATMQILRRIARLPNAVDVITNNIVDDIEGALNVGIKSALEYLDQSDNTPQKPSEPISIEDDNWGDEGFGY